MQETELELKFAIVNGLFNRVEEGLKKWHLGNNDFQFNFHGEERYTDKYYDSDSLILFKRGIYLRIRSHRESQSEQLCYRAFTAIGAKVLRLTEIIDRVSPSSLKKLVRSLKRLQESHVILSDEELDDFERVFAKLGLSELARVDIQRIQFVVTVDGQMLGLLNLDITYFVIGEMRFPYQEIEIKSLDENMPILDPLLLALTEYFPNLLSFTTLTKLERFLILRKTLAN